MRYLLVDGQGNFGSIDGDPPAAMRYTEVRLKKLAHELMADIDKETVNFVPNYDESLTMPEVLPGEVPQPPRQRRQRHRRRHGHEHPAPQPDARSATASSTSSSTPTPPSRTSSSTSRARTSRPAASSTAARASSTPTRTAGASSTSGPRPSSSGRPRARRTRSSSPRSPTRSTSRACSSRSPQLVNEKKIEGVADIRDESDREGMRVVVEVKKGELPEIILNNLYKHTQLQISFGIIMLAIVDKQPKTLGLVDMMKYFIAHRKEVILRRTRFELRKAEERAHILEGLVICLDNLDAVIKLIRASQDRRRGPARPHGEVRPDPDPGPGRPRAPAPAAEPARAAQDPGGVRRAQEEDRRAPPHPQGREARLRHHRQGAQGGQGGVRRRAPDRDPRRGHLGAPARGPGQGGGRRHRLHLERLHQADVPDLLQVPGPGRQGPQGHRDEGRGRRRGPLRLLDPQLPPRLHQPGPPLLAQGPGRARRRCLRPGQGPRQPARVPARREAGLGRRRQGVPREPVRRHADDRRHHQEDAPERISGT